MTGSRSFASSTSGGGGGGGTVIRVVQASITTGNVTLPDTSGTWQVVNQTGGSPFTIAISAAAGDYVDISHRGMRSHDSGSSYLDLVVVVSGTIVRYLTTGISTPPGEGDPGLYPPNGFHTYPGSRGLTVASGDPGGGNLTLALAAKAGGTGTLYSGATYPWYWRLNNHGTPA